MLFDFQAVTSNIAELLIGGTKTSVSAVELFYPVDHSSGLLPALNSGTAAMGSCHLSE